MKKGKLIVFEGGEGSGKTAISNMVCDYLDKNNIEYVHSREPGGTYFGNQIRNMLFNEVYSDNLDPFTELCLFEAARRQHYLQIIKPALDKGKVVILDRFILSTLAIQNFPAGTNVINILNNLATDAVKIDATILLDISPEVALKRIDDNCRSTNKNDRKPIEWHKNIRSLLLVLGTSMREKLNTHIIDADRDEDTIFNEVIEIVKGVIKDE